MSWRLADLFVELTVRGAETVQKALGTVHTQLQQIQAGAQVVGRAATYAFGAASLALGGFIKQGVSASAIGDVLNFNFERLSRTVAGFVGPELRALADTIGRVTDYLAGLSDATKEKIVNFAKAAAAGLAVAIVLPKVLAGVTALTAGLRVLSLAVTGSGLGAILPILGAVVTVLAGVAAGSAVAEHGFGGIFEALKPLFDTLMQFGAQVAEALKPVLDAAARIFAALWEAVQPVLPALMEMATLIGGAVAQAFVALEPAITAMVQAVGEVLQALAPLLPMLAEVWAKLFQLWVPVLQIVAVLFTGVAKVLTPLIELFVKLADILLTVVKPVLDGIAWVLDKVARAIAFLFGIDLDKQQKALDKMAESIKKASRGPEASKIGGFEALDAAYNRLAEAALKATAGGFGKSAAEQQVDLQKEANLKLGDIHGAIRDGKPLWNKG